VEELDKKGGNVEKTVSVLENFTRNGVKEGGVGGLQKSASEGFEPGVDAIIRI